MPYYPLIINSLSEIVPAPTAEFRVMHPTVLLNFSGRINHNLGTMMPFGEGR